MITKAKSIGMVIAGTLILMSVLWGGAYVNSLLDFSDWRKFPFLLTCMIVAFIGIGLTSVGVQLLINRK